MLAWVLLMPMIERGQRVVSEYAALGLTDTPKDIENRAILDEWKRMAKEVAP
jgi:hypothetical protein